MASLDEELLMDQEQDEREAEFILQSLPSELKERFTKQEILYMMDTIVEYYYESGILESDDDEIDIDLQQVAEFVCDRAKKENAGTFDPADVFFVAQADLDFQEQEME